MTEEIDFPTEQENPTHWKRFVAWLGRFDEAMNHDPLIHSVELIRHLGQEVARLDSRLVQLEDYVSSLQDDVSPVRQSPGTPAHINVFGYFHDIDTEQLTKFVDETAEPGRSVAP